jgi:DNA-binding beta-propeller fold protein YncE
VIARNKAYVSNWAGRHPGPGDTTEPAGHGTPVRVDPRTHVALDGSVSVVDLTLGKETGQIEVGLHPSGMATTHDGCYVCVANAKGVGSRSLDWKGQRKIKGKAVFGYNAHDYLGSVSLIDLPPRSQLASHTQTVLKNNRLTESISALAPPRENMAPRPVPERHGEPSHFKHVLYIIVGGT